jgi:hypothetical protein
LTTKKKKKEKRKEKKQYWTIHNRLWDGPDEWATLIQREYYYNFSLAKFLEEEQLKIVSMKSNARMTPFISSSPFKYPHILFSSFSSTNIFLHNLHF